MNDATDKEWKAKLTEAEAAFKAWWEDNGIYHRGSSRPRDELAWMVWRAAWHAPHSSDAATAGKYAELVAKLRADHSAYGRVGQLRAFHNEAADAIESLLASSASSAIPKDIERLAWDTIKEFGCHSPERTDVKLAKALLSAQYVGERSCP